MLAAFGKLGLLGDTIHEHGIVDAFTESEP